MCKFSKACHIIKLTFFIVFQTLYTVEDFPGIALVLKSESKRCTKWPGTYFIKYYFVSPPQLPPLSENHFNGEAMVPEDNRNMCVYKIAESNMKM